MNPMAAMNALTTPALPPAAQGAAPPPEGAVAPSRFADMLGDARAADARLADARTAEARGSRPSAARAREERAGEERASPADAGEADAAPKSSDDQATRKTRGATRGQRPARDADASTRSHARAGPAGAVACAESDPAADVQDADHACPAGGAKDGAPTLDSLLPGWVPPSASAARAAAPPIDGVSQAAAEGVDDSAIDTAKATLGEPAITARAAHRGTIDRTDAAARTDPPDTAPITAASAEPPGAVADRHDAADARALAMAAHAVRESFARAPDGEPLTPTMPGAAMAGATPPGLGLAASAQNAAALVHSHVSPPIDSPSFAPALATQVRWLVQEGVSRAQIQLNPTEMGPVTVRIVLEGREARVDFGADMAATRQVLEASLPVLAAAFDDSGLTLTGGSVRDGQSGGSQASPERQPPQGERTTSAHERAAGGADTLRPAGRGLVDLVA
ncbi:MAG: flagellar hook-length control protein FliK [Aquincola sp.]|nr:flagellar hook-length control protein FliK [Aquincola sp.]MDH4287565.1 flagellar hook-length control protein FliK [Aquincola sp.]MDH5331558.1 flagellar hook-length control protein FliK [Aquincola sp.]